MYRFAIVSVDGALLGLMAFPRNFEPGDMIPSGIGSRLRVVEVIKPECEGRLPVLVVEMA